MKLLLLFSLLLVVFVLPGADGQQTHRLTVATDAQLFASSGEILSREEQERQEMERTIRQRLRMREQRDDDVPEALSDRRADDQVKPGNPINVRVIDPDRCVSDQPDTVYVRVEASSGDVIDAFPLLETGPFTGVFEGQVPTDQGIAVAYATDSDEGRDPVFPISGGQHPYWMARPDNIRPKHYTVDLYDNVAPRRMRITADVPGRKLQSFILVGSLDGQNFDALGSYPEYFQAWDGSPRVEAARVPGTGRNVPRSAGAIRAYLDAGFAAEGATLVYGTHNGFDVQWRGDAGGLAGQMNLARSGEGSWYVARFSGGFYLDDRMPRRFELVPERAPSDDLRYFFLINGEPAADGGLEIERVFSRGVHRMDVYVVAQRDRGPAFEIHEDIPQPPYMQKCSPDMFDVATHPLIGEELARRPASITKTEDGTQFDISFDEGTRIRIFRIEMLDFEADAPAIRRIALVNQENERILPTSQDLMTLRENKILEIVPGDRITITYEDPVVVTEGREVHEVNLLATFHNATVSASFVEVGYDSRGRRTERFIPMQRFDPGDVITIFVNDPDEDVSSGRDNVNVEIRTSTGRPRMIQALETDNHSGVFTARIFPVAGQPGRPEEVQVAPGDDLIITYIDKENTNPGIPWRRSFVVEQVWYQEPELRVYDTFSQVIEESERQMRRRPNDDQESREELFPDMRDVVLRRPDAPAAFSDPGSVLIGVPIIAEVVFPSIAKSPASRAEIFMQTRSGREKAGLGEPEPGTFDLDVPGTIRREVGPGGVGSITLPDGYRRALTVSSVRLGSPLAEGRFSFTVPVDLDSTPTESLIDSTTLDGGLPSLPVRGNDVVYIGFRYKNEQGEERWLTHQVQLTGDYFFDIMDRRFQEVIESAYVGETLYLRVVDPRQDISNEQDKVTVRVVTSSGAQRDITLTETMPHSGVFRSHIRLRYAEADDQGSMGQFDFPVKYGDQLLAGYRPPGGGEIIRRRVLIHKGSDGHVMPFTKRFQDEEIAVQTQFTMAEAYFELAKRQRDMGQEELARRQIAQGRRLLEEALRDFPDTDRRSQADYLLAELSFEFGKDAVNEDVRRRYFLDALDQFDRIIVRFPDSIYAPRAQYKKGLVYEEMGKIEQASEEYVSLSYRYPDNELVAETIARLGQFFLTRGRNIQEEAEALSNPIETERKMMEARASYVNAAQVFSRLRERFPNHHLALRTTVLSGQSYMRAENFAEAIAAFSPVVNMTADGAEQAELIAEAMFWTGEAHMRRGGSGDSVAAYQIFRRLTWDYPASRWARFARGRLASAELEGVGN